MAAYSYTAKNLKGEIKKGEMSAESKSAVAKSLRKEGFVPTRIELGGGGGLKHLGNGRGMLGKVMKLDVGKFIDAVRGVPLSDKIMFSRHLAVMISAGVPITRAFEVLSKQTKNTRFRAAILKVEDDIRKGERISDALAKYPAIFDSLYISMVRSGDIAGNLTEVLELLANHLKKEHDLRSRIRGALMYPSVIVVAMGGIGALMMVMVVPKITDIFKDLNTELPILTRIIIGLSDLVSDYWFFILAFLVMFLYLFRKILSTNFGKKCISWILLRAPVFDTLTRKINSARFARTMSSLARGGVPVLQGILIVRDTLGNAYYRQSLDQVHKDVKSGKSLSESISKFENIYPSLVIQMLRVGEESGALGDVLRRIADFYEEEVDNATKNLSSIIEPVLMLIIGAIVGIFAISIIQPMYSLMGNI